MHQRGPGVEPGMEPEVEPGVEPKVEPGVEPEVEPGVEPEVEPRPGPDRHVRARADRFRGPADARTGRGSVAADDDPLLSLAIESRIAPAGFRELNRFATRSCRGVLNRTAFRPETGKPGAAGGDVCLLAFLPSGVPAYCQRKPYPPHGRTGRRGRRAAWTKPDRMFMLLAAATRQRGDPDGA